MPDESKKPDPLQASQPKIPGVPQAHAEEPGAATNAKTAPANRKPIYLWAGAGAAVVIVVVMMIWWARASSRAVHPAPATDAPAIAAPAATAAASAPALPIAPGPVATTEELARPWAAKEFLYRHDARDISPAMVVRLPGNRYWAFSLRVPYGTCELQFVTDMVTLRTVYKFAAVHPMVGDPCTHTVYDLTKYGRGPNGVVRGAVVVGTAIRPPLAIEVEVQGHEIVATRSEPQ